MRSFKFRGFYRFGNNKLLFMLPHNIKCNNKTYMHLLNFQYTRNRIVYTGQCYADTYYPSEKMRIEFNNEDSTNEVKAHSLENFIPDQDKGSTGATITDTSYWPSRKYDVMDRDARVEIRPDLITFGLSEVI